MYTCVTITNNDHRPIIIIKGRVLFLRQIDVVYSQATSLYGQVAFLMVVVHAYT